VFDAIVDEKLQLSVEQQFHVKPLMLPSEQEFMQPFAIVVTPSNETEDLKQLEFAPAPHDATEIEPTPATVEPV
jgi:hypothetical protein